MRGLVGTPAVGPAPGAEDASYTFLRTQPGSPDTPLGFDPCRPVDVLVNGDVDSPSLRAMLGPPQEEAEVTALMMHELGHVLGLGHSPYRSQVMHRSAVQVSLGDPEHLRILGYQPCRS